MATYIKKMREEYGNVSTNRIHEIAIKNNDIVEIYTLNDASVQATDAFAYGTDARADAPCSVALGEGTRAISPKQTTIGSYNQNVDNALLIIGNGETDSNRSNAFTVDAGGNVFCAGSLTTDTLVPTSGNSIVIHHDGIEDKVICESDLFQAQPTLILSSNSSMGSIVLRGYNLDPNKTYNVQVVARSHQQGTGEWRELKNDERYGYASLVGTSVTSNELKYPGVPSWMPNKGILQSSFTMEYRASEKRHVLVIPCSTWLLDLCKPLAINNTILTDVLGTSSAKDYTFSSNPPKVASLYGLNTHSGYRSLEFKFKLYDEKGTSLTETKEHVHISGYVHDKQKRYAKGIKPSSAFVFFDETSSKPQLTNVFIRIA